MHSWYVARETGTELIRVSSCFFMNKPRGLEACFMWLVRICCSLRTVCDTVYVCVYLMRMYGDYLQKWRKADTQKKSTGREQCETKRWEEVESGTEQFDNKEQDQSLLSVNKNKLPSWTVCHGNQFWLQMIIFRWTSIAKLALLHMLCQYVNLLKEMVCFWYPKSHCILSHLKNKTDLIFHALIFHDNQTVR